ncbi:TPA: hypothetical protein JTV55_004843 [Escherichia coli]|uniref:hypothetical protein n=1 Tax=Escherichia coli TaxID=562 RepID=UPI002994A9E5|nr:hypothetical protein [Escherichia coli]HAX5731538.1 hypothetical protein [Escherichia coli]
MLKVLKKIFRFVKVICALVWLGIGAYSIWLGFSKIFRDNSIHAGGFEAVSLLDTTPVAVMLICSGVLIITFVWNGYISKRLNNEA